MSAGMDAEVVSASASLTIDKSKTKGSTNRVCTYNTRTNTCYAKAGQKTRLLHHSYIARHLSRMTIKGVMFKYRTLDSSSSNRKIEYKVVKRKIKTVTGLSLPVKTSVECQRALDRR